ncbi:hypothetical protein BX285_3794 [Streptomyces sp. 1114.5]|uniref:hypothetical protein n=1 Tax=unclassified Streptomyces TaxID=2593676 RepID=UPI000BC465C3|nr:MULTISPECIES: hypothetical protein [unclassified Streptomyces]RKT19338.1 hypothetical protein BX285_3794 [Streptomyces sp. 1114.5]SOB85535.1 hypothetical protein SAMN06272789_5823 [Streptomyces sp. 1331.2]
MEEGERPSDEERPAASPWSGWIATLTGWIAPTTFVTAMLFFFGYAYTNSLYSYFGIDAATIGFSTQELLLRSSSALYLPAGVVLSGVLVAALAIPLVSGRARRSAGSSRVLRRVCLALVLPVAALLVLGLLAGIEAIDAGPMGTPVLIGGALLLALLARLLNVRGTGAAFPAAGERAALGVTVAIIALCAYWAVGSYAQEKGEADAEQLSHNLHLRPAVVLDTSERLSLGWSGVRETPLPAAEAGAHFRYRYEGLRLLAQAGGRMFLIPRQWTWETGNVLVLPVGADVRVAFHAG